MELNLALGASATTIFLFMNFVFALALIKKDNSIVDVAWGIGFILVAFATFVISEQYTARQWMVNGLVFIWGVRLALRIYIRNRGKGEDFRYKKWREDWGRAWVINSYLRVFLLQGVFLFLVSLPIVIVNASVESGLGVFAVIGSLVWLIGFYFEAVGDYQLDRFTANPQNKGKVLGTGLWHYSRHPNYFGEVVQWWGLFVIGLGVQYGWLGVIGPLTITLLILKVSGIPLLERSLSKNETYREYQKRTSIFWPLPPKKEV